MISSACKAFEGGSMFTQAMGALTDDSGLVYLPYGNNPERTGYNASELTALGGP